MRQMIRIAAGISLAWAVAFGQAAENITFEVASVKPAPPPDPTGRVFFGPPRGGPGTSDPGQITWTNAALRNIVMTAYAVQTFQFLPPDWLQTERYDIIAKVPAGATKAQVNVMWQNLLKERFGMVLHHEMKELPVETMTVAKGGLKMKETDLDPKAESFTPGPGHMKMDKNGMPEMNGSGAIVTISLNNSNPTARMAAKGLPSSEIANRLAGLLRRPVIDKTGLNEKNDFLVDFTPDLGGAPLPPRPPGALGHSRCAAAPAGGASDPGTNI